MTRGVTFWTGVLLMIPMLAEAGEVRLGAEVDGGWDSNVFRRGDDEIDSGVIALQGTAVAADQLERGSYSFSYRPTFFYNEAPEARNETNQFLSGEGVYVLSPRTSFSLSESFAYIEKLVYRPDSPDPDPNIDDTNRETLRNDVQLGANHLLTKRLATYGSASWRLYDAQRSFDDDSNIVSGVTGFNYALDPRLRVGLGGTVSYQVTDANKNLAEDGEIFDCPGENGPKTRSLAYSGFASLIYQWSETTSIDVRAGPARIESSFWQCVPFEQPPFSAYENLDSDRTTWFARLQATKRWENVRSSLSYNRSQGFATNGLATVSDSAVARADWQPARLWKLGLSASYVRQEQVGRGSSETNIWTVSGSVRRQLLRRFYVTANLSYRQHYTSGGGRTGDFDIIRAFAGFGYQLDPIRY